MKNLLNNLQRQVDDVKGQRIVAPFYPGSRIQVRVNGAILELEPTNPRKGTGFVRRYPMIGVWEIQEEQALFRGIANTHQRITYLNLLPQIRCLPVVHDNDRETSLFAIQSRPGPTKVDDVFPIIRPITDGEEIHLLIEYTVAFDGQIFWYIGRSYGTALETRAMAEHHEALHRKLDPGTFRIPGTWPGLVKAYATALAYKLEAEKSTDERLIESALKHAGSKLIEYNRLDKERFEVTFDVAGHSKKVTVDKNMNILTAGICLVDQHGEHDKGHAMYDLQSFVGVMREYHTGRY